MRNQKYAYQYHLMLLPVMAFLVIFHILPMFGVIIAFEKFIPTRGFFGSEFVGLKYFQQMLKMSISWRIFRNTVVIAVWKIAMNMVVPITFSILLNEVRVEGFKRTAQTIIYLPHFLSWVVLAIPIMNIFAYDGVVNNIVRAFGGSPILFMSSNSWFRPILIMTDVWKEFGFGTIVYLAAISGIDPALYESAAIDGANRKDMLLHITIPRILPSVMIMLILQLASLFISNFDQVYNLYNNYVLSTGDVLSTYIYRISLGGSGTNFELSTAMNLVLNTMGLIVVLGANKFVEKLDVQGIF